MKYLIVEYANSEVIATAEASNYVTDKRYSFWRVNDSLYYAAEQALRLNKKVRYVSGSLQIEPYHVNSRLK